MKKTILFAVIGIFLAASAAYGDENKAPCTLDLPDRAEDVQDIPARSGGGMFRDQITCGGFEISIRYSNRSITFGEKGFQKKSYKPFIRGVTREEILRGETVQTLAGTTLFFFNRSRDPLQVEIIDGTLPDFGMQNPALSSLDPVYSYTFMVPGTYTVQNKLKTYQQIIIDVKDPMKADVCVVKNTVTKNGVTKTVRSQASFCKAPRQRTAAEKAAETPRKNLYRKSVPEKKSERVRWLTPKLNAQKKPIQNSDKK